MNQHGEDTKVTMYALLTSKSKNTVEETVGSGDEGLVLRTACAETGESVEETGREETNHTQNNNLGPGVVVCASCQPLNGGGQSGG